MNATLNWSDWYHIVDALARRLSDERPRNQNQYSRWDRTCQRSDAVGGLRSLWATGDADMKRLIIARVLVWMCYDSKLPEGWLKERAGKVERRMGL